MFPRGTPLLLTALVACSADVNLKTGGCVSCHRPSDGVGIEAPHPSFAVVCGECHGGDPSATTIATAHVANPGSVDVRVLSQVELQAVPVEYRRFINPSDVVSSVVTCGARGGVSCHQSIAESAEISVHSSLAGVLNPERVNAGLTADRTPTLAPRALTDPSFEATTGRVEALNAIETNDVATAPAEDFAAFTDHVLSKACSGCHIGNYGQNGPGRPQAIFASGCATCHMIYAEDGLSKSADPNISRTELGHPVEHRLVRTMPDRQCENCHYGSNRIGMQFRGIRERTTRDTEASLANAERIETELHGKPSGFYVTKEDGRESIDLTPPDVHQSAGMGCVDCHVGQDVHGTGHLHATMGHETGVECEDCHGTFTERAGNAAGEFLTTGGARLTRVFRDDDGRVVLLGALDGREHVAPQLLDLRPSLALDRAHSRGNHGSLECYACHTAWMQNFLEVERTIDLRERSKNPVDASETAGVVSEQNHRVVLDALYLGRNADGKIGTFLVENALLSVVVSCDPRNDENCEASADRPGQFGRKIVDRSLRALPGDRYNLGFRPSFAHTVGNRATVRACETCHPRQYELDERRPAAAYGMGSGQHLANSSGESTTIDLTRMIDALGRPVVPLGHIGSAPVEIETIRRALNYRVLPPLR